MAIGIIAAVIACLLTGITKAPTVTENEFAYSVTYRLDGEVKTVDGVYKCKFNDEVNYVNPQSRYML